MDSIYKTLNFRKTNYLRVSCVDGNEQVNELAIQHRSPSMQTSRHGNLKVEIEAVVTRDSISISSDSEAAWLLSKNRQVIRVMAEVLTGHYRLQRQLFPLSIEISPICKTASQHKKRLGHVRWLGRHRRKN